MPESRATLPAIALKYMPAPPCPDALKSIIDRAATIFGSTFAQVGSVDKGSAVLLHEHVDAPMTPTLSPNPAAALFFQEVDQQHATQTYMELLSTPVVSPAMATLSAVRAKLLVS